MLPRELKKLNRTQRAEVKAIITDVIYSIIKANPDTRAAGIEKSLAEYLTDIWNRRSTRGNKIAVNSITGKPTSRFSNKDKNAVLNSLDKAYRTLQKEITPRVKRDTERVYNIYKSSATGQLRKKGITKQEEDEEIPFKDAAVIASLARIRNVSIGTHFERNLRPEISRIIETAVLDKGLNKKQAGDFLKSELTRKLGGSAFRTAIPDSVWEQGQKSVDNYFEGLSDTHMTMSKSFSNIVAMNEARIRKIQFVAIVDNRTSQICLEMDGRIWEIEMVNDVMARMLESENVDELKEAAPWKRDLSDFNVGRGERLDDPILAGDLAKAGVVIPPLHFRCRSSLQPL
jgi:hypothetical protein